MPVLTKPKILQLIKNGKIKVVPFHEENVGPGSLDLTLGNVFRVFRRSRKVYDAMTTNYQKITRLVKTEAIIIRPHETILGITEEKITLPPTLCGWLEGRSRFARLGLMIHISASFMHPGIANHQVLEISNVGHVPLRLHHGMKICQFVFQTTLGKASYCGKFQKQAQP